METHEFKDLSLKEQNLLLQSLLEQMPQVVLLFSLDERRNLFVNRAIHEHLGYTIREIHQMGDQVLENILHPDDLDELPELFDTFKQLQQNTSFTHINRWKGTDGDYKIYRNQVLPFRFNKRNDCVVVMSISEDITPSYNLKNSLMNEAVSLKKVLNQLSHGIRHEHAKILNIIKLADMSSKEELSLDELKQLAKELDVASDKVDEYLHQVVHAVHKVRSNLDDLNEGL